MKRLFSILAIAAMVSGCSKDDAAQPATFTLTGYSDINTRTAFGTPDTNSIPFVWSAGDKIWVDGGQQSSPLETGGVPTATFTFTSEPQEGATIYYNMKGLSAIANIPAEQDANNSLGLNGDFGYATVENGSFTLNHATAYLWFDVTRANGELEGATLESITIDASDATIAGTSQWNGSAFNTPTQSKSTIKLTIGKKLATENEGVMAAAVVLPTTLSKLTLTYEFTVGDKTKYYDKTIEKSRVLESGRTYRIAVEGLNASDLRGEPEVRVLTFEDKDYKGSASNAESYWSDLISSSEYGNGNGRDSWCDEGNTELAFYPSRTALFPGYGGHAISNYVGDDLSQGNYMYDLQAYAVEGGAHDSENFAVHFGYLDDSGMGMQNELIYFEFDDGVARTIDHMYVTNTTYVYNILANGDGWMVPSGGVSEDCWFKIIAYGYDEDDNQTATAEFILWDKGRKGVKEWTKWDLSSLGKVARVEFNLVGSEALYESGYGLGAPGYFAYDDVAVIFE
ncbi:MAG: DUF4465 domain-containing protein [Alistipes sp.]|nr:DUF4465 domain-containing protein [Alistipes sp.]